MKQTRSINLKVLREISCRDKVGGWVDARVVRAEVLEKVKAKAREEVAIADQRIGLPTFLR
jgi:hypothetical protein